MGNAGRFKTGARPPQNQGPGATDMTDANQSKSKSEDHEPTHHACDAPDLTATQFLYAVMRDRSLDLRTRIKAASKLMRIEPDGPPKPTCKIIIEGFPSIEFMQDLMYIKRCYDLGILPTEFEDMQVKGHA
jgi:hypothetical protein